MKLPLQTTIADGYRFLFTRIVSIIGTIWLPYLALVAIAVAAGYAVLPHGLSLNDLPRLHAVLIAPETQAARGVIGIAGLIVGAMVLVNLMRHSLGQKESTTWIYFSLAAPVWRMAAALLLAGLLFALAVVVIVLAGVVGGWAAFQHLDALAASATVAALALLGLFLTAYLGVRLLFFLPAVVVAEGRIGIPRAFALAKGNFWRIVVIWLAIAVPVWFVAGVVLQASVLPIIFAATVHLPRHPNLDDLEPLARAAASVLPVILPVVIAAGIAIRGFMAGAIGSAYKSVTGVGPIEDSV